MMNTQVEMVLLRKDPIYCYRTHPTICFINVNKCIRKSVTSEIENQIWITEISSSVRRQRDAKENEQGG